VLQLHNEILSHPPVNNAYRSEGSFTFTLLGRPVQLDPPQVRQRPVAFNPCGIFLPLCSCLSSCYSHVYISRKSHQNAPVTTEMNFPPNSFESRDCCQPQFSFQDLPTDVVTKMRSEYRMQYGYGDIIYVRHRFYSADPSGRAV